MFHLLTYLLIITAAAAAVSVVNCSPWWHLISWWLERCGQVLNTTRHRLSRAANFSLGIQVILTPSLLTTAPSSLGSFGWLLSTWISGAGLYVSHYSAPCSWLQHGCLLANCLPLEPTLRGRTVGTMFSQCCFKLLSITAQMLWQCLSSTQNKSHVAQIWKHGLVVFEWYKVMYICHN